MKKYLLFLSLLFIPNMFLFAQENPFLINHGPYLQYLTANEVTIVWTTSADGISWVELYEEDGTNFYEEERPKFYAASDGLKTISKIHKVTLNDLNPSTKYVFRIYSKEVKNRNYRNPSFGKTVASSPRQLLYFTTDRLDRDKTSCVVISDMHEDAAKTGKLLEDVDWEKTDFVVSDGDFLSDFDQESDLFAALDTCVDIFAKGKPLYMVRGNHETRGSIANDLKNYFHFPQNKYFYTFTSGSTLFIVLDGGEDKPDSDIEYNDLVDFDPYRTMEVKWLKGLIKSEEFKMAEHIIVFNHMPPYFPGRSAWHGDSEVRDLFVPVLNDAGIDLMISGHTHRYAFIDKKSGENNFPIIVMNNNCRMELSIDNSGIKATTIGIDKKVISQLSFE
jgi:predicted phosphodiesterase